MTFEEFFAKKKVDLVQLEKAEPVLYTEFKNHFAAMGEKSFDHTKKFWFNKLRRLYHLTPPDKAVTQVETAIASQAEPLSSPTIEQKPAPLKAKEEQTGQSLISKPAFKPRNIPAKAPESDGQETSSVPETVESKPISKPAFRPRNIPVKSKEETMDEANTETPPSENQSSKAPGFRPRNIKPMADENAADANRAGNRPGQPKVSETPITNPAKQDEAPKESYKPEFKLKNIPRNPAAGEEQTGHPIKEELVPESHPEIQTDSPVESDIERKISSSTDNKTPEQEIQDNDFDLRGSDGENAEEKPKSAYKPKFNLKNIKPRSDDDKNL